MPTVPHPVLFPAIDLKNGECVRLVRGAMDEATVYNRDPVAQARHFERQGFQYLHVVDLDGAFAGTARNAAAVRSMLDGVSMPIQLGGGIRTLEAIDAWLELGVARVILGTIALRDPELVRRACQLYPERIVVGIDARDGRVAVEGWAETSEVMANDLAARFADAGVAAIIHTDIDRDGVLQGVNWAATLDLASQTSIPVIASGGLASLDDIRRLASEPSLAGAITGRALYDGRIDPVEALAVLRGTSPVASGGEALGDETDATGSKAEG